MAEEHEVSGHLPILLPGELWQPFLQGLDLPSAPGPPLGPTLKKIPFSRVLGSLSQGQRVPSVLLCHAAHIGSLLRTHSLCKACTLPPA